MLEIEVFNADTPNIFNPAEVEFYTLAVYNELITTHNLSLEYHYKVAAYLEKALYEGFKSDLLSTGFTSAKYDILQGLRRHIYQFSAAKQYSQVREMSAFIVEKGNQSRFKEFKELADKVFDTYNKNYLRTEYQTAVGQSEMARQWAEIEDTKEDFPFLTYHTQGDARVRDEHAVLNGITRPVDDPFWNNYMPKNGWNCRCFVTKHERKKVTDLSERDLPEFGEQAFPKVFRMNPGKDRLIFNPKFHPYYQVAKGDSDWKAQNFGMPVP